MKNVNNRNATSHIAVISTIVLFRGNLTLGMFICFNFYYFVKVLQCLL
jgi:hypothetical protein